MCLSRVLHHKLEFVRSLLCVRVRGLKGQLEVPVGSVCEKADHLVLQELCAALSRLLHQEAPLRVRWFASTVGGPQVSVPPSVECSIGIRMARKPKLRMRMKPGGSRCRRKWRRNSSTGRDMRRGNALCSCRSASAHSTIQRRSQPRRTPSRHCTRMARNWLSKSLNRKTNCAKRDARQSLSTHLSS
jgi:hypothetical protein